MFSQHLGNGNREVRNWTPSLASFGVPGQLCICETLSQKSNQKILSSVFWGFCFEGFSLPCLAWGYCEVFFSLLWMEVFWFLSQACLSMGIILILPSYFYPIALGPPPHAPEEPWTHIILLPQPPKCCDYRWEPPGGLLSFLCPITLAEDSSKSGGNGDPSLFPGFRGDGCSVFCLRWASLSMQIISIKSN